MIGKLQPTWSGVAWAAYFIVAQPAYASSKYAASDEMLLIGPSTRICIDSQVAGTGHLPPRIDEYLTASLRNSLSRHLGSVADDVIGREDTARIVPRASARCQPARGDFVLTVRADISRGKDRYNLSLKSSGGGNSHRDTITRLKASAWGRPSTRFQDPPAADTDIWSHEVRAALLRDLGAMVDRLIIRIQFYKR
jgi:hypothetical protein